MGQVKPQLSSGAYVGFFPVESSPFVSSIVTFRSSVEAKVGNARSTLTIDAERRSVIAYEKTERHARREQGKPESPVDGEAWNDSRYPCLDANIVIAVRLMWPW